MKKLSTILATGALALVFAAPVLTTAAVAANDAVMTDHAMRGSKLIGAPVYNDEGQTIGSVVDILVRSQAAEPTAILSVGDFIGGGSKLVAVPLSHVNLDGGKAMMKGATRQVLASMPIYTFDALQGGGG